MSDQTAPHQLVHHFERTRDPGPVADALVDDLVAWDESGEFPIVILPGGGRRTDEAAQFERFKMGRELRNGAWVVVDSSKVVTYARTLKETKHGSGGALDLAAAKVVKGIVVGIYTYELDGDEYLRRDAVLVAFMRKRGRTCGRDWVKQFPPSKANPHGGDGPHFQLAAAPAVITPPYP